MAEDVHLTEPKERQEEAGRGELCGLVVVLERLVIVTLNVERACQLVAALRTHCLILCVVERMQGKMLHFLIVLEEEKRNFEPFVHSEKNIDNMGILVHFTLPESIVRTNSTSLYPITGHLYA